MCPRGPGCSADSLPQELPTAFQPGTRDALWSASVPGLKARHRCKPSRRGRPRRRAGVIPRPRRRDGMVCTDAGSRRRRRHRPSDSPARPRRPGRAGLESLARLQSTCKTLVRSGQSSTAKGWDSLTVRRGRPRRRRAGSHALAAGATASLNRGPSKSVRAARPGSAAADVSDNITGVDAMSAPPRRRPPARDSDRFASRAGRPPPDVRGRGGTARGRCGPGLGAGPSAARGDRPGSVGPRPGT